MKTKKLFYIALFSIGTICMNAQNVVIPDTNFKAALVSDMNINTNNDTEIQVSEAQAYAGVINVGDKNIADLTGIEAFINLTALYCHNNDLTALDISKNTKLKVLGCYDNEISALDVSQNLELKDLFCYINAITSIDVTQNLLLERLYLGDNDISTLDVTKNTALTVLEIRRNALSVLDVTQNTALTILACSGNALSVLDITKNTELTNLDADDNNLTFINLSQNILLDYISLRNNAITTLDISPNTLVTTLYCDHNHLVSLNMKNGSNTGIVRFDTRNNPYLYCIEVDDSTYSSTNWTFKDIQTNFSETPCIVSITDTNFKAALINNTAINTNIDTEIQVSEAIAYTQTLDIHGLNISDLTGIEAFVNITSLFCYNNQLTGIDVSQNTKITHLACGDNPLSNLDVSQNVVLDQLNIRNCGLLAIDISKNPKMKILNFGLNELTTLDTSQNPLIEDILIESNDIASLNLSQNLNVWRLNCPNNKLTELDISQNAELRYIVCNNNELNSLNVANGNNSNFSTFNTRNNTNLTCIEVDNEVYSTANWTLIDSQTDFSENCTLLSSTEFTIPNQIQVYPNPVKDYFYVQWKGGQVIENVEVFSLLGEKILEDTKTSINFKSIKKGIYIVKITNTEGAKVIKKILKE